MNPVPLRLLLLLLTALTAVCLGQWWRESDIHRLAVEQRRQIADLAALKTELEARTKAADAEILRLTAALAELRASSVSKDIHSETEQKLNEARSLVTRQNEAITTQNTAISQLNDSVTKANAGIKALAAERDALADRLNELTDKYNALVKSKAVD